MCDASYKTELVLMDFGKGFTNRVFGKLQRRDQTIKFLIISIASSFCTMVNEAHLITFSLTHRFAEIVSHT